MGPVTKAMAECIDNELSLDVGTAMRPTSSAPAAPMVFLRQGAAAGSDVGTASGSSKEAG